MKTEKVEPNPWCIRVLDQALQEGLVLNKVHGVICFPQSDWLKNYINISGRVIKVNDNILVKILPDGFKTREMCNAAVQENITCWNLLFVRLNMYQSSLKSRRCIMILSEEMFGCFCMYQSSSRPKKCANLLLKNAVVQLNMYQSSSKSRRCVLILSKKTLGCFCM